MPPVKRSVLRLKKLKHSGAPLASIENSNDENSGVKSCNLRKCNKNIIINVRNFFQDLKSGEQLIDFKQVTVNTALCAGVSERTVKKVIQEQRNSTDFEVSSPKKSKGRPCIIIDEFLQGVIRRKVHSFFLRKEFPTILKVLHELRLEIEDFPDVSESTMLKWVKKLGFSFRKLQNKPVLMESPRISDQRHTYLRTIKRLRAADWEIFYSDETWCGTNHTVKYTWQEKIDETACDSIDFDRGIIQEVNGWKGGIKTPSGAGKRIIILHIESEKGFLKPEEETMLVFEGKKNQSDYHSEMNAQHFEEYFRRVLLRLPEKSVLVLDQAPYHTMQDPSTKNPSMSWRKSEIIDWLVKRLIEPPVQEDGTQDSYESLTKTELIELGKPKFKTFKFLLEKIIVSKWTCHHHCRTSNRVLLFSGELSGFKNESY